MNPGSKGGRRPQRASHGPHTSVLLEKTWIDADDDEEEFEDAGREENEDF